MLLENLTKFIFQDFLKIILVLGTAGQTIPMFLKEEGLFTPEMQFLESQDLGAYGPGDGSDYQPFNLDEDW